MYIKITFGAFHPLPLSDVDSLDPLNGVSPCTLDVDSLGSFDVDGLPWPSIGEGDET